MLRVFPNVCVLRVRMPISDDLSPRNFITKIVKYEKVLLLLLYMSAVVVVVSSLITLSPSARTQRQS